jgi:hypothetical protein
MSRTAELVTWWEIASDEVLVAAAAAAGSSKSQAADACTEEFDVGVLMRMCSPEKQTLI